MLLFWNPGCGFCRSLHEDLLAWEATPPEAAPALVVVLERRGLSASRPRASRARSCLDAEWAVSSELGADGTPMALLVSAERRIASPIVSGGPAVLELLGALEVVVDA